MKKIYISILSLGIAVNCYAQTNDYHNEFNIEPNKKKNFIGLGSGQTIFKIEKNKSKSDSENIQEIKERKKKFWNIYTGHQLSDSFSVKAEYLKLVDLKSSQDNIPDIKMRALSFSGLGFYPLNRRASMFGEAGLYVYRIKESYEDNLQPKNQTIGNKPFLGVGVKYDLGKTDLILKYNNYGKLRNDNYKGNLAQIKFNVQYKF